MRLSRFPLVLFALSFSVAHASGMPPCEPRPLDLGALHKEADLVAVGRIVENHPLDKAAGDWTMELKVTHLIKGDAGSSNPRIHFMKPDCTNTSCGGDGIPPIDHEFVFFLAKEKDGTYRRIGLDCSATAAGDVQNGFVTIRSKSVKLIDFKRYLEGHPEVLKP